MKIYLTIVGVLIFSFSCTFSKYRLPYKVKSETYIFENNYQIELDSSELIGINFGQSIQQIDENGEHSANIFRSDSLNVFEITKQTSSFIQDLNFNINKKSVQIDSMSFLIVFMDSIEIDTNYNVLDSRHTYINPSDYIGFKKENEPIFDQDMYLIDGLIIYSKKINYVFTNYILWY